VRPSKAWSWRSTRKSGRRKVNSLSQLVKAVNEGALELRKTGVDTYTVAISRAGRGWRVLHTWQDGHHVTGYCATFGELWDELDRRLAMMEMRLEERTGKVINAQ
jgi:hypothetical protein